MPLIPNSELNTLNELIFKNIGLKISNMVQGESSAYGACDFQLEDKNVQFRISKITPKKVGQFVAIWKRNAEGITCPFDVSDDLDFFIIASQEQENCGLFIFPKAILQQKGIVSKNKVGGKNGIRVYPSWDIPINKQAIKTKNWQIDYFIDLAEDQKNNLEKTKRLLNLQL